MTPRNCYCGGPEEVVYGHRYGDGLYRRNRAPDRPRTCVGADPNCPCQDGDVCHYVDDPTTGTRALPVPRR